MTRTGSHLRALATGAVLLLVAACSSREECVPQPSPSGACPDLSFGGRDYNEWREADLPEILQEVGNATYPACNAAETCASGDLDGYGATDVWLVTGVDVEEAVIGLREGTRTHVIFVRVGVDPNDL